MTTCIHCHGEIVHVQSPTPELGGDWWHVDAAGERTSMTCCVVETGAATDMEIATP